MQDFEKLGLFYLGREYDLEARQTLDRPVLYDSRDLVTHAVCVGMTGSGKTGLCIGLLEEALIDGVPVIAIDPKGDLGNLLLTFPELSEAEFRPWIDEEEARREGVTPEAFAAAEAVPADPVAVVAALIEATTPALPREPLPVTAVEANEEEPWRPRRPQGPHGRRPPFRRR